MADLAKMAEMAGKMDIHEWHEKLTDSRERKEARRQMRKLRHKEKKQQQVLEQDGTHFQYRLQGSPRQMIAELDRWVHKVGVQVLTRRVDGLGLVEPAGPLAIPIEVDIQKKAKTLVTQMFTDAKSTATKTREQRWGPVFTTMDSIGQCMDTLEAAFALSESVQDAAAKSSSVKQAEREEALHEGLGNEADEVAAILVKRLGDIKERLQLLEVYDKIRQSHQPEQSSESDEEDRAFGEKHQSFQSSAWSTGSKSPLSGSKYGKGTSILSSHHEVRPTRPPSQFQRVVLRLESAMRVQAVYRGYLDRRIYGNVREGIRTFFHAKDRRWATVWVRHFRGERRTAPWLLEWVLTFLNAKIIHDHLKEMEGQPQATFNDYLKEHIEKCYASESAEAQDAHTGLLLRTVYACKAADPLLKCFFNFMMETWDHNVAGIFIKALCVLAWRAKEEEMMEMGLDRPDVHLPPRVNMILANPLAVTTKLVVLMMKALFPAAKEGVVADELLSRIDQMTAERRALSAAQHVSIVSSSGRLGRSGSGKGQDSSQKADSLVKSAILNQSLGQSQQQPATTKIDVRPQQNELLLCICEMVHEWGTTPTPTNKSLEESQGPANHVPQPSPSPGPTSAAHGVQTLPSPEPDQPNLSSPNAVPRRRRRIPHKSLR